MSRVQNEHRRVAAYVAHHALGKGAVIPNYLADLASGIWLSSSMSPDTRLFNAWVAYYLELLMMMDAEERHHIRMRRMRAHAHSYVSI